MTMFTGEMQGSPFVIGFCFRINVTSFYKVFDHFQLTIHAATMQGRMSIFVSGFLIRAFANKVLDRFQIPCFDGLQKNFG